MLKSKNKNLKSKFKKFYLINLIFQLGFTIITSIFTGVLLGVWLDKKMLTSPLFTLSGAGLGIVVSVISVWDDIKNLIR